MRRRAAHRRGLHSRTEQTAIGVAAVGVPISFQRTLMPRSNLDQAIVTGLSLIANHALAALVQDTIAAGALALVAGVTDDHDRRWGQVTLVLDASTMLASVAVQRALRPDAARTDGPIGRPHGRMARRRHGRCGDARRRLPGGPSRRGTSAPVPGGSPDRRAGHRGRGGPSPTTRSQERRTPGAGPQRRSAPVVGDERRRHGRRAWRSASSRAP